MLNDLLGVSAALVAAATLLLLVAGRHHLPGYLLRVVLLVALLFVVGVALRYVDPIHLHERLPSPANPVTIVGLAVLVVTLLAPRRWWAVGAIVFSSLVVATVLYLGYLVEATLALSVSPASLILGFVLLFFQVIALALMIASIFEMVDALCRPVEVFKRPPEPAEWPTVAFQVPVHQEPADLVISTIHSLIDADYPREHLVVQVIDNNTPDEELWRPLDRECARLRAEGWRVEFIHLEHWPGFKAGALNYGTEHLPEDAEVLVIVDADYVVAPDFLKATVPYFRDRSIAFVQTPQDYRAWSRSGFYRACHTGFDYFFKVGMISRSYRNSIIFAGTMGLIRRSALEAIGGWDEAIITEDAEASLRILALGYRSVYVPKAFGRGIMPLTYEGLRSQRFRWAFGGMQILRKHWRQLLPWSESGLTQRQRRDYLLGGLGWMNDAMTFGFWAFIAATALGYLTGHPFVVQRLAGLGLILPSVYILLGLVRYIWGLRVATGVSITEALAAIRVNLSLSWVVTLALVRGAIEKQGVFLRTPKFAGAPTVRALRVVWVEALLALSSVILCVAVVLRAGITSGLALTIGVLLAWSAIVYGSAVDFAIGDPTRPPEALREKAALETVYRASALGNRAPAYGTMAAALLGVVAIVAALGAEAAHPAAPGNGPAVPPPQVAQAPSQTPGASSTPAPTTAAPTVAPTPTPTPVAPVTAPPATPAPVATPTPAPTAPPAATAPPAPVAPVAPAPTPTP